VKDGTFRGEIFGDVISGMLISTMQIFPEVLPEKAGNKI
jgi:hypothetical protein